MGRACSPSLENNLTWLHFYLEIELHDAKTCFNFNLKSKVTQTWGNIHPTMLHLCIWIDIPDQPIPHTTMLMFPYARAYPTCACMPMPMTMTISTPPPKKAMSLPWLHGHHLPRVSSIVPIFLHYSAPTFAHLFHLVFVTCVIFSL